MVDVRDILGGLLKGAVSLPATAVGFYLADQGSIPEKGAINGEDGGAFLIPSTNALHKYVDLKSFTPDAQKLMRELSILHDFHAVAKPEQREVLKAQTYKKFEQLAHLPPEAARELQNAARRPEPAENLLPFNERFNLMVADISATAPTPKSQEEKKASHAGTSLPSGMDMLFDNPIAQSFLANPEMRKLAVELIGDVLNLIKEIPEISNILNALMPGLVDQMRDFKGLLANADYSP